jgi:hypothetical protein
LSGTGAGPFVGTDIIFEFIVNESTGTTVYCGVLQGDGSTDTNCLLNFDTAADSFVLTAPSGLYDETGALLAAGPITLLEGTFSDFGLIGTTIFGAEGPDTKSEVLLRLLGLDPAQVQFTYSNSELRVAADGTVLEADLSNTSVPEPGVLALFGLGLVAAGRRFARRRG